MTLRPRATKGRSALQKAPHLLACLLDEADGEEGAPAAKRPSAAGGLGHMHAIAGGLEHGERRLAVLGLEIGGEGVDEEDDLGAVRIAGGMVAGAEHVAPPKRELARARRSPSQRSPSRLARRDRLAQVDERCEMRGARARSAAGSR